MTPHPKGGTEFKAAWNACNFIMQWFRISVPKDAPALTSGPWQTLNQASKHHQPALRNKGN
jgi:hypothetical protein